MFTFISYILNSWFFYHIPLECSLKCLCFSLRRTFSCFHPRCPHLILRVAYSLPSLLILLIPHTPFFPSPSIHAPFPLFSLTLHLFRLIQTLPIEMRPNNINKTHITGTKYLEIIFRLQRIIGNYQCMHDYDSASLWL